MAQDATGPKTQREGGALRVAVVDDDQLQLACTTQALSEINCDSVPFASVERLIQLLMSGAAFDCILMAVHGPRRLAFEQVLDLCKADRLSPAVPALMIVAHETELPVVEHLLNDVTWSDIDLLRSPIVGLELLLRLGRIKSMRAERARLDTLSRAALGSA